MTGTAGLGERHAPGCAAAVSTRPLPGGNGQLFAFFDSTPPVVAEIDKATAAVSNKTVPALSVGTSFAFAHWGGRFFLFADAGIHRYDPVANETVTVMGNVGFKISGAGVSTCAPTEVPR